MAGTPPGAGPQDFDPSYDRIMGNAAIRAGNDMTKAKKDFAQAEKKGDAKAMAKARIELARATKQHKSLTSRIFRSRRN